MKEKMKNEKYTMKNSRVKTAVFFLVLGLLFGYLLTTDHSPLTTVRADTGAAKSTGLTAIPDLEKLGNKELRRVLEQILQEQAVAIDTNYRMLLNDVDTINRDEIPGLQTQIDGIDVTVDFDIPMIRNVVFSVNGSNYIIWTAGELEYGGETYTVNSGNAGAVDQYAVYFDMENLPSPVAAIDLVTTGSPSYSSGDNRWFFCYKDASNNVYPALQQAIIHAGLIQANTITATQIVSSTITTSEIAANTITADDIAANTITAGQINTNAVGSDEADITNIFSTEITVNSSAGEIHSTGKDDYEDATSGFWLGYDSGNSAWCFDIGDSSKYLRWDGSDLYIASEDGSLGVFSAGTGGQLSIDGDAQLVSKKSLGGGYYSKVIYDSEGMGAFIKNGGEPAATTASITADSAVYIGWSGTYIGTVAAQSLAGGSSLGLAGNYYFAVSPAEGRFGASAETQKITYDTDGKVTIKEECITGGTAGFDGSWVNNEGDTVTVVNGIITTVN